MNEESLFHLALQQPDAAARAAFLDQACANQPELRARLEKLLQAHDAPAGFFDKPAVEAATSDDVSPGRWINPADAPRLTEGPGTRIGPYKLLQQIGEGGMGVVYMAEQQEPLRRMVALKIIKPGMDSATVVARFEAERQALALMDHQNIARVFDGGTTETGRPFFVMELVKGIPITRFADENRLTPRERLELFVPVCQAVQHAHQKGVIHRDLKPTNVLVTLYDGKPVPKVIDFGVAKALHQKLTERTMFTAFGTVLGTLEYMSPEQAEMNALDVDTRSDVYSLGILLYELLTGTTPLQRERLRQAAYTEMLRLIREEEPPRPSTRISGSGEALARISAQRKTEPAQLARLMRGELDWIVMKALEKDRGRRYETAIGLARDVDRYLKDEPVEACPPSVAYRLGKFARKYRVVLTTAAAFAVLLVAGVVLSTLLAVWARSAEQEANRQRITSDEAKQDALDAKVEADKQRDGARLTAYAAGMNLASRAWEDNNVPRARELLEEVPKSAAGRDLRGFEWYYLSRVCNSEMRTLEGHTHYVNSVAFSPDGRRLASGSADRTVKIWDSATGKELLSLNDRLSHPVFSVAFSPDGQRLAAGADSTVKIWDSATGKELVTLKGHTNFVSSVVFSPDGQRLASGSSDSTVKIWDSDTGKELISTGGKGQAGFASYVHSVAFSPDGRRLASGGNHQPVTIWDSATGKELLSLKGDTEGTTSVAFSPDGRRLASGIGDESVKIWDSATGKELLSLKGHTNPIWSVAFSPDGQRLASGGYGKTVKIWDSATGKELVSLKGHGRDVHCVAFSPDGQRLASGSNDKTVKIWDTTTGKEPFSIAGFGQVAFSPDGQRLASWGEDKTVKIRDSATGKELLSLKGHGDTVLSVAFSPDGQRLASGSKDETVKIWDSATGKELASLKGHALWVHTVKIWDSAIGKELASFKGNASNWGGSEAISPDGQHLASVTNFFWVKVCQSATGKELFSLNHHGVEVLSVEFSQDGQRLASGCAEDGTIKIWDSATGKELFSLKGHSDSVWSLAFSPDGQRLASGSKDETVKIWDSATGKELISLKGPGGQVSYVAFSPDGQRLASVHRGGLINLWETSVSPEIQRRREANQLVAGLFQQKRLRADVLEQLRTAPGMSQARRQEALAAAQTYPENPLELNALAWEMVKLPGRAMSNHQKALRYSEEACQIEPKNGDYLNTLGVASYRLGTYEKALETLLRSDQIHKTQYQGSIPTDLAFLAMSQQHLGHAQEAQAYLQRLRECMKIPRWAQDTEAQSFLREAEALLAKPKAPGGK